MRSRWLLFAIVCCCCKSVEVVMALSALTHSEEDFAGHWLALKELMAERTECPVATFELRISEARVRRPGSDKISSIWPKTLEILFFLILLCTTQ